MTSGELKALLNQYPESWEVQILERTRAWNCGILVQIESVDQYIDQDTHKINIVIRPSNIRELTSRPKTK